MPGRSQEDSPGTRGAQEPSDHFGELLRTFRQNAGMTQRELADRASLSVAAIRDLEQGRTRSPKADSIQVIAAALALSSHDAGELYATAVASRPVAVSTPAAGPLRIGILGPMEIWHGDVLVPINSGPQRTLLARLAIGAGTTVSQDELIELLWQHDAPPNAVNLLRTRIARLRRLLEPRSTNSQVIVGSRAGYKVEASSGTLDLLTFRELTEKAAVDEPAAALAKLSDAVALWRGDTDVETLAADALYIALSNEYADVIRTFATLSREVGDPELALNPLRDLTARHELDEPLYLELIQTLAAADRQAEALAAYDRIRSALADQLGIDPSERIRAVHLEVLRQQSGSPAQPARRVLIQQTPAAPPDFVGRAEELATICTTLGRPGALSSRVVLINGIAGVGKTALSLTAAHQLRAEYPDGQLYADLRGSDAATPAPLQVLGRFLRALGVPGRRIGTDETESAALLRSELADRRMLLLLDNAQDAAQIRPLLPGAGRSDVIVTSRRRLPDLATAGVVNLEPLPRDDAILLIASTARTDADPDDLSALAEACARLPLALRIASARLATRQEWTVADLTRRLDDGNQRLTELSLGESSVLNSFQLSYADLGSDAQRAFRLCSLHPGDDFSADSTAILLGMPTAAADRVLDDLLEANMLMQHTKNRYRFHDLLGLYSRRLLAEDAEGDTARSRLYSWYAEAVTAAIDWAYPQVVRLAAHPEPFRFFDSETAALDWLDDELRALLAVVTATEESGERSLSWRIVDQLRGYFLIRRHADGWLPAAEAGLAAALTAGDDLAQVAMLMNRGQALGEAGRDEDALSDCLAGHALAVAAGWTTAAGYLAHQIGWLQLERGTLGDADPWMRRALELTEGDEDGHIRAIALNGLGMTRLYQGELQEAADLLGAAVQISEAGPDIPALAIRGNLASALRQLGAVDRATGLLTDVLNAYRQRSHLRGELSTLDELSRLHSQGGDGVTALEVALRAHDLALVIRDRKAQAQTAATVAQAHLALDDALAAIEWSEDCLAIARGAFPYVESQALLALAAARHINGDTTAAIVATELAAAIAGACGFGLLEAEATTSLLKYRAPR